MQTHLLNVLVFTFHHSFSNWAHVVLLCMRAAHLQTVQCGCDCIESSARHQEVHWRKSTSDSLSGEGLGWTPGPSLASRSALSLDLLRAYRARFTVGESSCMTTDV